MGLEVVALLANGMPRDAKRFGNAEDGGQVIMEHGRKWGMHRLQGRSEENEVIYPFNCWTDHVEV